MSKPMKAFIAAILLMGVGRFTLSISGFPNTVVKFASMTGIIIAGAVYFAITASTHKERLKDAYLLVIPYMIIEVSALGYSWATGVQTIFHANEYNLGSPIAQHTIGHLVGGLTWEPLAIFLVMEVIWAISTRLKRLRRTKPLTQ